MLTLIVLAGCGLETQTLSEFYPKDLDDVTKITLVDGSTGNKKYTTNQVVIKKFLNQIKAITFIPDDNQEERTGWRYSITLYQQNERTFQFTLTEIEEHYYHSKPDIFPIVDEFYENGELTEE
ncbi:hypothetical protein CN378_12940 [Bacillus sp. AFS015802]|uniref:hypothetical protein n=1 Tax=Bacillus sp. AFS015802 TaxID=2033486 RepID=UPI000BF60704|nr:hypothetical protein [Bacillus sp. AFS015802]PFA66799.1 hypothetical protein CN378_12940 [Bacillus sp. AFS015802]